MLQEFDHMIVDQIWPPYEVSEASKALFPSIA